MPTLIKWYPPHAPLPSIFTLFAHNQVVGHPPQMLLTLPSLYYSSHLMPTHIRWSGILLMLLAWIHSGLYLLKYLLKVGN